MKPSKRHALTDTLCAEVTQKIAALEKTLSAQGITSNGKPSTPVGNPLTTEQHTLLAERVWWEKAQKGLEDVRSAIEEA